MRDRPGGAELLWQAREVLREELLPRLPEDKRYDGLMIAAAMAAAARELEAGEAPPRRLHAALVRLYGGSEAPPVERGALDEALRALETRLARDIRDGRRDADGGVHALLCEAVIDRVRESNPRALKTAGVE